MIVIQQSACDAKRILQQSAVIAHLKDMHEALCTEVNKLCTFVFWDGVGCCEAPGNTNLHTNPVPNLSWILEATRESDLVAFASPLGKPTIVTVSGVTRHCSLFFRMAHVIF